MNQEKIGKFIAECRKKKKMTQQELADKLGITDKAISKWENGRCMPDISILEPLTEELGITINELIKGERIKKEKQEEQFNENIKMTLKELEISNKLINNLYAIIFLISFILIYIVYWFLNKNPNINSMYIVYYLMFGLPIMLFILNFVYSAKYKDINIFVLGTQCIVLLPMICLETSNQRLLTFLIFFLIMTFGQFLGSKFSNSKKQDKKKKVKNTFIIVLPVLIIFLLVISFYLITNKTFFKNTYIGVQNQEIFIPKYSFFYREAGMTAATFYSFRSEKSIQKEIDNYLKDFKYFEDSSTYGYMKGDLFIQNYEVNDRGLYRVIIIVY